jgi:hypothetical protein
MNHTTLKLPTSHQDFAQGYIGHGKASMDLERITYKKLMMLSCLILLNAHMRASFVGGFVTAGILATGVTLAATQGSRSANRDPYYEVDRERARQEVREIREETRLKREEDRERKKFERKQAVSKKSTSNYDSKILDKKSPDYISQKELEINKLQLKVERLKLEQIQAAS